MLVDVAGGADEVGDIEFEYVVVEYQGQTSLLRPFTMMTLMVKHLTEICRHVIVEELNHGQFRQSYSFSKP